MQCNAIISQPVPVIREHYPHLIGLDLADVGDGMDDASLWSVKLLIGVDHYWLLVSARVRRETVGPIAIETRIGWVISRPIKSTVNDQLVANFVSTHALRVDTSIPFLSQRM